MPSRSPPAPFLAHCWLIVAPSSDEPRILYSLQTAPVNESVCAHAVKSLWLKHVLSGTMFCDNVLGYRQLRAYGGSPGRRCCSEDVRNDKCWPAGGRGNERERERIKRILLEMLAAGAQSYWTARSWVGKLWRVPIQQGVHPGLPKDGWLPEAVTPPRSHLLPRCMGLMRRGEESHQGLGHEPARGICCCSEYQVQWVSECKSLTRWATADFL